MDIELIPLLQDNYAYLLRDGGFTALVDPADGAAVENVLERKGYGLDLILNTHHHYDHTGGNAALKARYGCVIAGPAADAHRIDGLDRGLKEGDVLKAGDAEARIIETPGHTSGGIAYYFGGEKALFCGDTLFSLGCGRLFEGTAAQMWGSLSKLMALPDETRVYCGHEYTLENGAFCLRIEPENEALQKRMEEAHRLRTKAFTTIPSTMGLEKKTNVFLRAGTAERFAALRSLKDAG